MLPKAVLVDWDSTLNNFDEHMLDAINEEFGTKLKPSDLTHWGSLRAGADALTEEQEQFAWGPLVFGGREWNAALRPTPGSLEALWQLYNAGVSIHLVSARPISHRPILASWVSQHGLDGIVRPACVQGSKVPYAKRHGVSAAFDDSPRQICDLVQVCTVYVIDRPYNRSSNLCPGPFDSPTFGIVDTPNLATGIRWLLEDQLGEEWDATTTGHVTPVPTTDSVSTV